MIQIAKLTSIATSIALLPISKFRCSTKPSKERKFQLMIQANHRLCTAHW
jgi:hypothetical protein